MKSELAPGLKATQRDIQLACRISRGRFQKLAAKVAGPGKPGVVGAALDAPVDLDALGELVSRDFHWSGCSLEEFLLFCLIDRLDRDFRSILDTGAAFWQALLGFPASDRRGPTGFHSAVRRLLVDRHPVLLSLHADRHEWLDKGARQMRSHLIFGAHFTETPAFHPRNFIETTVLGGTTLPGLSKQFYTGQTLYTNSVVSFVDLREIIVPALMALQYKYRDKPQRLPDLPLPAPDTPKQRTMQLWPAEHELIQLIRNTPNIHHRKVHVTVQNRAVAEIEFEEGHNCDAETRIPELSQSPGTTGVTRRYKDGRFSGISVAKRLKF